MSKLKQVVAAAKKKFCEYKTANEKLGLGFWAQRRIVRLGKRLPKITDETKQARLKARGARIVARGERKIRARNAKKCWIEVTERHGSVHIFAAVYGTGYPAEISYEEAVRFAELLNEHDDKTGIELTVRYGFGFQQFPIYKKMLPQARREFNKVALAYCQQLIDERKNAAVEALV